MRVHRQANEPTFCLLDFEVLTRSRKNPYRDARGMERPIFPPKRCVFFPFLAESLDDDERRQIEIARGAQLQFLAQIPWTQEFDHPQIAGAHP